MSFLQCYCLFKDGISGKTASKGKYTIRLGVEAILKNYILDVATYKKICTLLDNECNKGLSPATNDQASVKMYPTYVRGLPDGSEQGHFLALDLGGTNFRVLLITLKGIEVEMKNKIFPISQELMHGEGTLLFDYIAECLETFQRENDLVNNTLSLGFTFSFPCKQEGLTKGKLVKWTKGFTCAGVENEDVVELLNEAIARRGSGINIECTALLNDTVGCLMSCAFLDHNSMVGVILGTGTNACYMEHLDKVLTWEGDLDEPKRVDQSESVQRNDAISKKVIINTEWGAFGDNGELDFIRTDLDRVVDTSSLNPGKQIFEKMISGMYMGELVRLVILKCAKEELLFKGVVSQDLQTQGRFYTKYISEIEKDEDSDGFTNTKQILDELGVETYSMDDCRHIQYICSTISSRAAYLASAGIATLLNRVNMPNVTVAVDGSLYRFHPHFHQRMMEKTKELLNNSMQFHLMLSEDGSGKGAALVAAVASRMANEGKTVA
ncbi:Hexokinase type 2 [Lamellibrachia satsuma]|nr:Hexokinase type 2 [Lamellibrachia satsuma]